MPYREQIPIDKGLDNSIALMLEGYNYISNRRHRYNSDIFQTRLLGGQKAICIAGSDVAEVFYDNEKFQRHGVAPKRIRETIFGEKSVQTLDNAAHENRKRLLMSLMTEKRLHDIEIIFHKHWEQAVQQWRHKDSIILFEEAKQILTKTACNWAGVPLKAKEVCARANQLAALFDSAAAIGPRHWQGRIARNNLEGWLKKIIAHVRSGNLEIAEDTALSVITWHRDIQGKLLDEQTAAVEVINILRPIVAIAVYIVFIALALHTFPMEKNKLKSNNEDFKQMFVQEVRRYYPFFPFAAAKVRQDFLWKGHDFRKGNLVLLDIYGTNHHPKLWKKPHEFNPDRFQGWEGGLFDLIPQGGGDFVKDHRCAGEWLTVKIMRASVDLFINGMEYDVPKQDLRYSMIRMPSLPKSRFVMTNIRTK